jgi:hypothetical protein
LDVPWYEWIYKIFISKNEIMSVERMVRHKNYFIKIRNRVLKNSSIKNWHLYVNLHINWIQKTFHIHQIVMLIKEWSCPEWMEVLHWDWNPKNNHPDNLRYWSHKDNYKDSIKHWTSLHKKVLQYSKKLILINEYISIKDAKIKTWIDNWSISKCCNGIRKFAGGFIWKYKN